MRRRIACVALPEVRIELAEECEPRACAPGAGGPSGCPLVVVVARPGGAVKTERDVLGNTRIDFASREARAQGVRSGQTVAAARARCASLRVRVVAQGEVSSALARLAETALAFGPTVAFDVGLDVVWVDVGGCAHLHGGEVALGRALVERVRALGHACRVAIADGPRIAAAVARFSHADDGEPLVVGPDQGGAAIRALPVAALGLEPDVGRWLTELGLPTCGDLQRVPRRALRARLEGRSVSRGANGRSAAARRRFESVDEMIALLDGEDGAPLDAWRPPDVPEERVEFDWGVETAEPLAFVAKRLCDRLAARLKGRAMAAAGLELVLTLDRACRDDDAPSARRMAMTMAFPSPVSCAGDLLSVVRARLDRCTLPAAVRGMTLRVPELSRAAGRTLDLFVPEPKAAFALPRLAAELTAQFGAECVGILSLADTWCPDGRTVLRPLGVPTPTCRHTLVTSALEPSRVVRGRPAPRQALAGAHHLARIGVVEWWREHTARPSAACDLFAAWIDGALGWLELRALNEEPTLRGWLD